MEKHYEDFIISGNTIIIKDHVKAAKPITGTKMGAITEDNPFSTPFVAFMDMYRFSLPFVMTPQIEKGMEYEPLVIKTVNEIHNMNFADYTPQPYYDFPLKDEGAKYNGKIDGWDKEKKIVLECKVTKIANREKWLKNHPPKYYLLQMMLYGKMAGAKEIWLSAYFIQPDEYSKPLPNQLDASRLKVWKYKIDKRTEKFFNEKLKITNNFLENNIKTRVSPPFNLSKKCDRDLFDEHVKDY